MSSEQHPTLSAFLRRGMRLQEKGKLAGALEAFDQALAIDPTCVEAHCHRGNVLADQGHPHHAIASYEHAIMLAPRAPDPHDLRGIVLAQSGHVAEALHSFDKALGFAPDHVNALYNRALALKQLGQAAEALGAFDRVLALQPRLAAAHHDRGHLLATLGRQREALASFDEAIRLDPRQADAHCNRAAALEDTGQTDAAVEGYRQALKIDAGHVAALVNLAALLLRSGENAKAATLYRRATAQDPDNLDAWQGQADALSRMRRFVDAIPCYQRVLKLDLARTEALYGLAHALGEIGRIGEQVACYDHLIAIDPDAAQAHFRRGSALGVLKRHREALASLDRALEIDPGLNGAQSDRLHAAMFVSRWQDFEQNLATLCNSIDRDSDEVAPFALMGVLDDPERQLRCARQFAARRYGAIVPRPIGKRYPPQKRIRIGYFSADFHRHATLQLFLETLEAHDRTRFEPIAFVFGTPLRDAWSERADAAFDRTVDVRFLSNREVADLAREMEIDIAVDLKGFTGESRTGIFIERAAPVQISYLGYPGTSGMAAMDYLMADHVLVPEDQRRFYSEKIIYLPGSYQPNAAIKPIASLPSRGAAGLPADGFVYCCFNRSYKITPETFAAWMRILRRVEGSILWLWAEDADASANLRREAEQAGVAADRLIFAEGVAFDAHLARLRLADLFLDTLPYNAHTTASDALQAGVPVLTHPGSSFASRVAASLLTAVGLPELIAPDRLSYEDMAVALAEDRARHNELRSRLQRQLLTTTLFDPVDAARKLEAAYVAAHQRQRDGQPPANIFL